MRTCTAVLPDITRSSANVRISCEVDGTSPWLDSSVCSRLSTNEMDSLADTSTSTIIRSVVKSNAQPGPLVPLLCDLRLQLSDASLLLAHQSRYLGPLANQVRNTVLVREVQIGTALQ